MVKIRLKRIGRQFEAIYRIVVADSRSPRDGKYIEEIGFYNPHTKEAVVNVELRTKWIKNGAQVSETVSNLFKKYDATKKVGNKAILAKEVKKATTKATASKVDIAKKVETKIETPQVEAPKVEEVKVEAPKPGEIAEGELEMPDDESM